MCALTDVRDDAGFFLLYFIIPLLNRFKSDDGKILGSVEHIKIEWISAISTTQSQPHTERTRDTFYFINIAANAFK